MATPFTYTNWAPGEPNDHKGEPEDCVEYIYGKGWNDVPCYLPLKYICEIDSSKPDQEMLDMAANAAAEREANPMSKL